MENIAFIVGIAAVIFYIGGYLQKRRKYIIGFNVTARVLYILQYILLGAFEGAVLDVAGIISSVLAQKKDKPLIKKHIKLCVYKNVFSLLPIIGVLLHTSAFWITDEKKIRIVSFLGSPFWLAYNLVSGAYGSCVGDVLSMVSIVISMIRYDLKGKK